MNQWFVFFFAQFGFLLGDGFFQSHLASGVEQAHTSRGRFSAMDFSHPPLPVLTVWFRAEWTKGIYRYFLCSSLGDLIMVAPQWKTNLCYLNLLHTSCPHGGKPFTLGKRWGAFALLNFCHPHPQPAHTWFLRPAQGGSWEQPLQSCLLWQSFWPLLYKVLRSISCLERRWVAHCVEYGNFWSHICNLGIPIP